MVASMLSTVVPPGPTVAGLTDACQATCCWAPYAADASRKSAQLRNSDETEASGQVGQTIAFCGLLCLAETRTLTDDKNRSSVLPLKPITALLLRPSFRKRKPAAPLRSAG